MIDPITVSQVNKNTNAVTSTIETTIGESNSTDTTTVFGKLNQILSGGDTQAFKNLIQRTGTEFKPPSGIAEIGINCCAGYSNLITVSLPDTVTTIKADAFELCTSLTNINLPSNITSLGSETFYGCIKLNKVENFENTGITIIPASCFRGCSALKDIVLNNSITKIGKYAFQDCNDLTWTSLPDSVTIIEENAFNNCKQLNIEIGYMTNLTNIGSYAFFNCTNVNCHSIYAVNINYIGTRAFQNTKCSEGDLHIHGNSNLNIGSYAFSNVQNLKLVKIFTKPAAIATSAFSNNPNLAAIIVTWSENELEGAPWGAANATIVYDAEM